MNKAKSAYIQSPTIIFNAEKARATKCSIDEKRAWSVQKDKKFNRNLKIGLITGGITVFFLYIASFIVGYVFEGDASILARTPALCFAICAPFLVGLVGILVLCYFVCHRHRINEGYSGSPQDLYPYPASVKYLLATEYQNVLHWKITERIPYVVITVTLENKITHVVTTETWKPLKKEIRTDVEDKTIDLDNNCVYYPYYDPLTAAFLGEVEPEVSDGD